MLKHRCETALGSNRYLRAYNAVNNGANKAALLEILQPTLIGYWHLIDQIMFNETILKTLSKNWESHYFDSKHHLVTFIIHSTIISWFISDVIAFVVLLEKQTHFFCVEARTWLLCIASKFAILGRLLITCFQGWVLVPFFFGERGVSSLEDFALFVKPWVL